MIGNLLILLATFAILCQHASAQYTLSAFAGTGTQGSDGDNGPATSAKLNFVPSVWTDSSGQTFIVDYSANNIRRVDTSGIIKTIGGTGSASVASSGGAFTSVDLYSPWGLFGDTAGTTLYISDNYHVWKYNRASGIVSILAGTGSQGTAGNGGPAISAQINKANGLWLATTNILYIGEYGNNLVRMINLNTGIISTYAGGGGAGLGGDGGPAVSTNTKLNSPQGIYLDTNGQLFVADRSNGRIRLIAGGIITTYAGGGPSSNTADGYAATNAYFSSPFDVKGDSIGNIFIVEGANRVRVVDYATKVVTLYMSTGLSAPRGIWLDRVNGKSLVGMLGYVKSAPLYVNPVSTSAPSASPTFVATNVPTATPTAVPTAIPSRIPTTSPTANPSAIPTVSPSAQPTFQPTFKPTAVPSAYPSAVPTRAPTVDPTANPSAAPSANPTTNRPSFVPTNNPTTNSPSTSPTTAGPSASPSTSPTFQPSSPPSYSPSENPTFAPSTVSVAPSIEPTTNPSQLPSTVPTITPTFTPSTSPTTAVPSINPTFTLTAASTPNPTVKPSASPTTRPTSTEIVSALPTVAPTNPNTDIVKVEGSSRVKFVNGKTLNAVSMATLLQAFQNISDEAHSTSITSTVLVSTSILAAQVNGHEHVRRALGSASNRVSYTYDIGFVSSYSMASYPSYTSAQVASMKSGKIQQAIHGGLFQQTLRGIATTRNATQLLNGTCHELLSITTSIVSGSSTSSSSKTSTSLDWITGTIIGGVLATAVVLCFVLFYYKKHNSDHTRKGKDLRKVYLASADNTMEEVN